MILLIFLSQLFALDVAIQGDIPDIEFEKQVMESSQLTSYIEHVEKEVSPFDKQLKDELRQAQFEFLNGSVEKSIVHFKNVAELSFKKHWKPQAKKMIHFAHLRLAQLSETEGEKTLWMRTAFFFSPKQTLDTSVFSPEFIEKYSRIKAASALKVVNLPKGHENFQKIIINGVPKKDQSSFLRTHGGTMRLSFLSNKYQAVHVTTDATELKSRTLPLIPLAKGNCLSPEFSLPMADKDKFVLLGKDCKSSDIAGPSFASMEKPKVLSTTKAESTAFYKKTWFWIGVSVVVTGLLVYHHDQQRRQSPSPSASPSLPPPPAAQDPGAPTPREISNRP